MVSRKVKQQNWLINPATEAFYESPRPLRRYLKLLVDPERFPNTPLTIALVKYPCDARGPLHRHRKTTEVYFVLAGELTATVDGKRYRIKKGQLLYIPPRQEHQAENRGKRTCYFMAVNTPLGEDMPELKVKRLWKRMGRQG